MNQENLDSIKEIFDTARAIKGDNFVKFVRFSGVLQGYCLSTLAKVNAISNDKELFSDMVDDASTISALLTDAYATALNLSDADVSEALELVDTIDKKVMAE
jgi:hypothetical protein